MRHNDAKLVKKSIQFEYSSQELILKHCQLISCLSKHFAKYKVGRLYCVFYSSTAELQPSERLSLKMFGSFGYLPSRILN